MGGQPAEAKPPASDTVAPQAPPAPGATVTGVVVDEPPARNTDFSSGARDGARESLAAAAGSMPTSFDHGFSGNDESNPTAPGASSASSTPPAAPVSAAAATGDGGRVLEAGGVSTVAAVPVAPGRGSAAAAAIAAPAASSSAGIADEDMRDVARVLMKRLSSGMPLTPDGFRGFSDAVDRILESTAEGGA